MHVITSCKSALACDRLLDQEWIDPDELFIKQQQQNENADSVEVQPMTIGVGVLCSDGVVLGTDSEYTISGQIKILGPKLFTVIKRSDVVVIAAGAGRVTFMKRAAEEIGKELQKSAPGPSLVDIRSCLEVALRNYYALHVFSIPEDARPTFSLLFAVWAHDGFKLLSTDMTSAAEVDDYASIGSGQYVSHYAVDLVRNAYIAAEQGKFAVVHSIRAAKQYVAGCGKQTQIWTLGENGSITRSTKKEIDEIEEYSVDLENALQFLNVGLDLELNPGDTDSLVADFRTAIEEFKSRQKARREAAERRRLKQKPHAGSGAT